MTVAGVRYNNPFNISLPHAGYFGGSVVGLQGQPGYATFPSMATGYAAGSQRLTDYISGNTSYGTLNTIGTLGPVYATDPNWAAGVSRASGIGINTVLDPTNSFQMQNLQSGILQQELGSTTGSQLAQQYGGVGLPTIPDGPAAGGQGFNVTSPFDPFPMTGPDQQTSVAQAAASGGGMAADQTTSQVDAKALASAGSGSGGSISGTGSGLKLEVGPQPGLTQLVSSTVKDVENAFGSMAQKILGSAVSAVTNYFGITGNLFIRLGLIVLGVVVIAVALNKLMGGPDLKDVAAAAATAARAA